MSRPSTAELVALAAQVAGIAEARRPYWCPLSSQADASELRHAIGAQVSAMLHVVHAWATVGTHLYRVSVQCPEGTLAARQEAQRLACVVLAARLHEKASATALQATACEPVTYLESYVP
jgi:hypothetical protein